MGVYYYAKAAIGLKIQTNKLFITKIIKAFNHNYSKKIKYCPKTGKACWSKENYLVKHPEGRPDLAVFGDVDFIERIGSYEVYQSNDLDYCIIAIVSCSTRPSRSVNYYDLQFVELPNNFNIKIEKFKEDMEICGLWNERDFGLYAIPYTF